MASGESQVVDTARKQKEYVSAIASQTESCSTPPVLLLASDEEFPVRTEETLPERPSLLPIANSKVAKIKWEDQLPNFRWDSSTPGKTNPTLNCNRIHAAKTDTFHGHSPAVDEEAQRRATVNEDVTAVMKIVVSTSLGLGGAPSQYGYSTAYRKRVTRIVFGTIYAVDLMIHFAFDFYESFSSTSHYNHQWSTAIFVFLLIFVFGAYSTCLTVIPKLETNLVELVESGEFPETVNGIRRNIWVRGKTTKTRAPMTVVA